MSAGSCWIQTLYLSDIVSAGEGAPRVKSTRRTTTECARGAVDRAVLVGRTLLPRKPRPWLLILALGAFLLQATSAGAVVHHRPPTGFPRLRSGTNTELTLTSLGPGTSVTGFIADPSNPFDP